MLKSMPLRQTARSPFKSASNIVAAKPANGGRPSVIKAAGTGRELWGNVVAKSTWGQDETHFGLYTFRASSTLNTDMIFENTECNANSGAVLIDGVYHTFYFYDALEGMGWYTLLYTAYDAETGEIVSPTRDVPDLYMTALDLAYDEASGKVYGVFYNSDFNGLELGVADFSTLTRTTIASVTHNYVALGMSNEGMLYGVASDGNFYKINKTTGAETKVGATGLTVANSKGQYYTQSGDIDPATNTFYWAAIDINAQSALYTVDLNSGAASKIADFPNSEQVLGLVVPPLAADNNAPAKSSNLKADFKNGSTSGSFSFKVANDTYGGQALGSGESLTYKVYVNDELKAQKACKPGEDVTVQLSDVAEGLDEFKVIVANSAGDGAKAYIRSYVGYDIPVQPTDVAMTLNGSTGAVSLTWTAPEEGVNKGYLGQLTYDVVRYPDGKKVKEGTTETSFTETLDKGSLKAYYYGVTAINNGKRSQEALSDAQKYGDAAEPPYYEPFDNEASFSMLTIINANEDDNTWAYEPTGKQARYKFSYTKNADDWLITPPIKVKKDHIYTISYVSNSEYADYPERMEVKYGSAADPAQLTETLFPLQMMPASKTTFTKDIVPSEDMNLYIGFHAVSPKNQYYLNLDDISVSEGRLATIPGKATNLKVKPAERGGLSADVSFNAPTTDYAGNALQGSLTKVELLRGDSVVNTFSNVATGTALNFVDIYKQSEKASYTVVAYNTSGKGVTSDAVTAFVGNDAPEYPKNIKLADNTSSITMSWDKVSETGANGGYVDPSGVKYRIYDAVETPDGLVAQLRDETAATSYNIPTVTNEGEQEFLQFGVDAYNAMGQSRISGSPTLITGKPYSLPFVESFPGKALTYDMWWSEGNADYTTNIIAENSFDGDGGTVYYQPLFGGDVSYLNSGKIAMAGANAPMLVFSHKGDPGQSATLTVQVAKPDGTTDDLNTYSYPATGGEAKWSTESIDLSAYKDLAYVIIKFLFTSQDDASVIYLDAISVRSSYAKDLSASISAPAKVTKGKAAEVTVKVSNFGSEAATGYTVKLLADGNEVASANGDGQLEPLQTREFKFDYKPSTLGEAVTALLKAEVSYSGDLEASNNTAETEVTLESSTLPKPESVTAEEVAEGVKVSWVISSKLSETVLEDFESYPAWSIDNLGEWGLVDRDGGENGRYFSVLTYPHEGEPFAYVVFNPEDLYPGLTEQNPQFAPKSGNQYLLSGYPTDYESKQYLNSDDWLISPLLPGHAQTITFWASNLNEANKQNQHKFNVMVSTTGKETTDFHRLGSTYTQSSGTWTQYTVDLPEGTKYFAINNISDNNNSYAFFLDDITFEKAVSQITGFNVYRDGVMLQSVAADARELTDGKPLAGSHTYSVTALYDEGESAPTSATLATAIGEVVSEGSQTYTVYSVDGRLIAKDLKTLGLLRPGVYVVNNRKLVIK